MNHCEFAQLVPANSRGRTVRVYILRGLLLVLNVCMQACAIVQCCQSSLHMRIPATAGFTLHSGINGHILPHT